MKKQNIIYIVLGVVVLSALGYFLLRDTKKADGHDHNEAEAHKEQPKTASQAAIKEVELNEAQYKASDIVLGGFSMKNLSDVVNANGYTKLPPQNQADISVYMSLR